MQFLAALELAMAAISVIQKLEPIAAKAITNFKPIVSGIVEKFTGDKLTDEQRNIIDKRIIANHERFQQPISS